MVIARQGADAVAATTRIAAAQATVNEKSMGHGDEGHGTTGGG